MQFLLLEIYNFKSDFYHSIPVNTIFRGVSIFNPISHCVPN